MNNYATEPVAIVDFESERKIFCDPKEIITANSIAEVYPAIQAVDDASQKGYFAVGYVSYEAGWAFNDPQVVPTVSEMPLVWFAIFSKPTTSLKSFSRGDFNLSSFEPSVSRSQYELSIQKIREAIAQGDTYQVNYTMRMAAEFYGDDLALYESLATSLHSKYCAYLNMGRFRVLSLSPELFFTRNHDEIITRPMKGTAKRGRWSDEDEELRSWLMNSKKNRAENIMIVDLLRNDLGRIAETGSVSVPNLLQIEKYPNVYQMTSTVKAKISPAVSTTTIFEALFPCGSVTGAPKLSTMSLIKELEPSARGVYCGSIGILSPARRCIFNVAIRTLVIDSDTGSAQFGTGGGVTWDSLSDEEYEEALAKAEILQNHPIDFQLLETFLLEDGTYFLLDPHLRRLEQSAKYFEIPFDREAVEHVLFDFAAKKGSSPMRVRLLYDVKGVCQIESSQLESSTVTSNQIYFADLPVSKMNRFLYHKTTKRGLHEKHRQSHPTGFDVLLWNEDGQITEFTNGNVVVNIDGAKVTPPLECGLLPGTFRAELLGRKEVTERILYKNDLLRANDVWFVNSVRKWVKVELSAAIDKLG